MTTKTSTLCSVLAKRKFVQTDTRIRGFGTNFVNRCPDVLVGKCLEFKGTQEMNPSSMADCMRRMSRKRSSDMNNHRRGSVSLSDYLDHLITLFLSDR